ncbi:hypothetical protein NQ318_015979 [Aromia moschata]|uniref:Uncharacterized protein n=1 Tax=Aromia moschata TaxID=1265417 RepID=A0AAV8XFT1_9CUCU|nr:hypothetical protein NQ318_015979 [Aromia moschata]
MKLKTNQQTIETIGIYELITRVIGRRGPIEWPVRLPDLTPLAFFLFGCLKSKVYTTEHDNINILYKNNNVGQFPLLHLNECEKSSATGCFSLRK